MDEREWLTERFEQHRTHLRPVADRMLGSGGVTDDVLPEAWLTPVVGWVCLNRLRSRRAHRGEPSIHAPDPGGEL